MHKDTIKGAAKDAAGSIKEATGKATGNERLQAEGAAEKAGGSAQNAVGKAQDKLAKTIKH